MRSVIALLMELERHKSKYFGTYKNPELSKQRLENEFVKMSIDLKAKQNIISQLELNINILKDKNQYLTDKLSVIIKDKINIKKNNEMQLS